MIKWSGVNGLRAVERIRTNHSWYVKYSTASIKLHSTMIKVEMEEHHKWDEKKGVT